MDQSRTPSWTDLIDEVVAGRWVDPETGRAVQVPYERIVIDDTLEGAEAELVRSCRLGDRIAVVSDETTHQVMGARIERALGRTAGVDSVVLSHPHADEAAVESLRDRTRHADGLVAVGSGTVNDLCKYVTYTDGRVYCVFGTAPSMNGYTSTTASITLPNGLKVSKPAHAARGVFIDLTINAAAPQHMIASGLGDSLCRPTAQVDWYLSHRLFGTRYMIAPYLLQERDEAEVLALAGELGRGSVKAVGHLHRLLTLCGLGLSFSGGSHPGSMGEHQISHYIDCYAGDRHPGTLHGQQVGIASLTMARLQHRLLASEAPPVLRPTVADPAGMARRYGLSLPLVRQEFDGKTLDAAGAATVNRRLAELWPTLRHELLALSLPPARMEQALRAAGGATTATELGLNIGLYREAVLHAREIRNRFSMLDIAAEAGLLEDFVAGER